MSRGRSRHQVSRRRSYSHRQREVRERQLRVSAELQSGADEREEREAGIDLDSFSSWQSRLVGRASAA